MKVRKCSSCGSPLIVPTSALGKNVKCKKCGAIIHIPDPREKESDNNSERALQENTPPPDNNSPALSPEVGDSSEIESRENIQEDDSIRSLYQENDSLESRQPPAKASSSSPTAALPKKNPVAEVSAWLETREKALEKFVDIAQHAGNPLVREKAVRKIDDQAALGEIAQHDDNHWVREAAVKRLSDQKALIAVARSDSDHWVREAAVKKINDREVLSEIAKTDQNHWVCEVALRQLGVEEL